MSITTDRIARKPNGVGGKTAPLDDHVKSYLFEALGSTLDSIVIGVIIVGEQGRILHANQAAQRMFAARSQASRRRDRACAAACLQRPPYIGCRGGIRDARGCRVAGRDRHRGADLQPDAG